MLSLKKSLILVLKGSETFVMDLERDGILIRHEIGSFFLKLTNERIQCLYLLLDNRFTRKRGFLFFL